MEDNEKNRIGKFSKTTYFDHLLNITPSSVYWKGIDGTYLGCNRAMLEMVGLSFADEVIGKTDHDLPWKLSADELRKNDQQVIDSGKLCSFEETGKLIDGSVVTVLSNKMPLFDESGQIIGIIGSSIDVTRLKRAEAELRKEELSKLKLENEINKKSLESQKKFTEIANQVAHDIRSPLSSLMMVIKSCVEIPEVERIALREASSNISDIANNLLKRFSVNNVMETTETDRQEPLLVSITLMQLISDKKYEYPKVTLAYTMDPLAHFSFIKMDVSAFRRMISNLINNAVDACTDDLACVDIHLESSEKRIRIHIKDNGRGMSADVLEKINRKTAITSGKKEGHGIGLMQVQETLRYNRGTIEFRSELNQGTCVTLTFSKIEVPNWMSEEIELRPNDVVIILDDDTSIHGAWDTHFQALLKDFPTIQLRHFSIGQQALIFIQSLSTEEKKNIFLLTDYELLKQSLNGLQVIEKSEITRSLLVTSYYADPMVQQNVIRIGSKILPKQMASEIPIKVYHEKYSQDLSLNKVKKVDLILLDDDARFVKNLESFIFYDVSVDSYHRPEDLLTNLSSYPKNIKILLDNQFKNSHWSGIDTAEELHKRGYTELYLLSGQTFEKNELPSYLTAIAKEDIDGISNLIRVR